MQLTVDVPHKMLFSGSYTVLDGAPALAVAIPPRLQLTLHIGTPTLWPQDNPFAQAVLHTLQHTDAIATPDCSTWGTFQTTLPAGQEVKRWGIGSSSAFTTALMYAALQASGQTFDRDTLFALARTAHRRAQGGKGSGADIAACCYGEVVLVSHAQGDATPTIRPLRWPTQLGLLLLRTRHKADTRAAIARYQHLPTSQRTQSNRPLIRAVGAVCRAFHSHTNLLQALTHNNHLEDLWSQELNIPLVTDFQRQLQTHVQHWIDDGLVVLKALGAGGGDSIACFFSREDIPQTTLLQTLDPLVEGIRPLEIDPQGAQNPS